MDHYCKKIAKAGGGKAVCRKWAMELESDLGNWRAPSRGFAELAGSDLACRSSLLWAEIAEQEKSLAFERKGQSSTWKKV